MNGFVRDLHFILISRMRVTSLTKLERDSLNEIAYVISTVRDGVKHCLKW